MALSLPGMSELASRKVSPSLIWIWWSPFAIRASAAIGSPCDPVQMSVTLLSGIESSFFASTTRPRGMVR